MVARRGKADLEAEFPEATDEVHDVNRTRITVRLRPVVVNDQNLSTTRRWQCDRWKKRSLLRHRQFCPGAEALQEPGNRRGQALPQLASPYQSKAGRVRLHPQDVAAQDRQLGLNVLQALPVPPHLGGQRGGCNDRLAPFPDLYGRGEGGGMRRRAGHGASFTGTP